MSGDSLIRHAKCGGKVFVDVSPMIRFSTPAMAFTPKGVILPVLEIFPKPKGQGSPAWYCQDCQKEISGNHVEKELEIRCMVCSEWKAMKDMHNSHQIPTICGDCCSVLTGKSEPRNSAQRRALEFLSLGDNIKFVKFSDVIASVEF